MQQTENNASCTQTSPLLATKLSLYQQAKASFDSFKEAPLLTALLEDQTALPPCHTCTGVFHIIMLTLQLAVKKESVKSHLS